MMRHALGPIESATKSTMSANGQVESTIKSSRVRQLFARFLVWQEQLARSLNTGESPRMARIKLALLAVLLTASVWSASSFQTYGQTSTPGGKTDLQLFGSVISRMQRGEPYYGAMGQELRAEGYPTASVFNWRTPAWYYAMIWPFTSYLFIPVTFMAASLSLYQLNRHGSFAQGIALIALVGASFATHPVVVQATEPVCGVFIAYSLFAYRRQAWITGAAVAVLALFVRELAAPYVVVCAAVALRHRRWRECAVWVGGAVLYFIYFAWHAHMVTLHQLPGALSHRESWIQGGGLRFMLAVVSSNVLLAALPTWVTAVTFVSIVAGITSSRLSSHLRACALIYLAAFAVIGYPFNWYWGWVPIFAFAVSAGAGAEIIGHQVVLAFKGAGIRPRMPVFLEQ